MIYLQLFFQFFKTGLFSVGGGLATLPFLYEMSNNTHWFTHSDIADMIAISECTPGAIGINMSTYAGYITGGIAGGCIATFGLACPSVIIILLISRFLEKFRDSRYVARAFYGLRPASIAMISAAGINVVKVALINLPALTEGDILGFFKFPQLLLAVILFIAMRKLKWHPIAFLAISAVVGILFRFAGA
ncbi:MAG: chromate transporter [Lachnospiraceae bacterium]|nr:chromate transporter [Lachnospiraceae bacterium]